jgi:hypothetical protein
MVSQSPWGFIETHQDEYTEPSTFIELVDNRSLGLFKILDMVARLDLHSILSLLKRMPLKARSQRHGARRAGWEGGKFVGGEKENKNPHGVYRPVAYD